MIEKCIKFKLNLLKLKSDVVNKYSSKFYASLYLLIMKNFMLRLNYF
jgi:hypothetical protein